MIRLGEEYEKVISAACDFGRNRQETRVSEYKPAAKLFRYALRSLDVYQPTRLLIEGASAKKLAGTDRKHLENAIRALNLISDFRYHPSCSDHRVFPSLREYYEAINLVEGSLTSIKDKSAELASTYHNFCSAVEKITLGNGLHVVNWKAMPEQSSTVYTKVNLEISRLVAGEHVGVYTVKVKGRGKVPHHSHTYLWEHHFLPEPIEGVHQLDRTSARCTQSDIVYIRRGKVHAFRNDEEQERTFLFICGSKETGPWDFVQDITTYPKLDFPKSFSTDVGEIGGRRLKDFLDNLLSHKHCRTKRIRLTPDDSRLSHHAVLVTESYRPPNWKSDVQYYVAHGSGILEIEDHTTRLRSGDAFVVPSDLRASILNNNDMVLYEFGLDLRRN